MTGRFLDGKAILFDAGLRYLASVADGRHPNSFRPLVGKWLSRCGNDPWRILALLDRAEQMQIADPKSWIERTLQDRKSGGGALAELDRIIASDHSTGEVVDVEPIRIT